MKTEYIVRNALGGMLGRHESYRAAYVHAAATAGMVHLSPAGVEVSDRSCWRFTVSNQGCKLSWDDWRAQDDEDRLAWEQGASAIPTA